MRKSKYGKDISLRDTIGDIISEALPYDANDEKRLADAFTTSKKFDNMLDDITSEVDGHISYNFTKFSEEVTK